MRQHVKISKPKIGRDFKSIEEVRTDGLERGMVASMNEGEHAAVKAANVCTDALETRVVLNHTSSKPGKTNGTALSDLPIFLVQVHQGPWCYGYGTNARKQPAWGTNVSREGPCR